MTPDEHNAMERARVALLAMVLLFEHRQSIGQGDIVRCERAIAAIDAVTPSTLVRVQIPPHIQALAERLMAQREADHET